MPILASDGLDSPKFPELAGKDAEGVVLTSDFSRQDPRPLVQEFITNYRNRYGGTPDFIAASAYDCVRVIADAVRRVGPTADQIRAGLAQTRNFEGVAGNISFDENREVVKTIFIVRVDNGEFVYVDKIDL
jgi:branched-chain amino acid transport system substrate-binding protein